MLYADLTLPDDVRDALVDDINHLPFEPFKEILEHDSDFARGFRPDPKNLATFRKKLVERLLHRTRPLEEGEIWAIRAFGFNMKLVCVFSTAALTDFFDPLAGFIGGAKLLAGMLVDRRKGVVGWAKARAADGKPLPPPPAGPEEARAALRRCFAPFLDTMSAALVAPVEKRVAKDEKPAPVPDEAIKRDVAKLMKKFARVERDVENANHRIVELVRENVRLEALLAEVKKDRNAALEAAKDAKRDLKAAKRAIRRAKPGVEAAEEAQTEAEERAREAKKRAREAERPSRRHLPAPSAPRPRWPRERTQWPSPRSRSPPRPRRKSRRPRFRTQFRSLLHLPLRPSRSTPPMPPSRRCSRRASRRSSPPSRTGRRSCCRGCSTPTTTGPIPSSSSWTDTTS